MTTALYKKNGSVASDIDDPDIVTEFVDTDDEVESVWPSIGKSKANRSLIKSKSFYKSSIASMPSPGLNRRNYAN